MSRIDFGKIYTIEHNTKVRSLGKINRSSDQPFLYQFKKVWESAYRSGSSSDSPQMPTMAHSSKSKPAEAASASSLIPPLELLIRGGYSEEQARELLGEREANKTTRDDRS